MIRQMTDQDIAVISQAFSDQGWHKSQDLYKQYLKEMKEGKRLVLVAELDGHFAGYVTIDFESDYPYFKSHHIPEICDLNVLIKYRRKGIGYELMMAAEDYVKSKYDSIGLRVGLLSDYGAAQRLYIKLGYNFDGLGISKEDKYFVYFDETVVDDDLVLGMTKSLTYILSNARLEDLEDWMRMVSAIQSDFPGFAYDPYKNIVRKNIQRGTALCVRLNHRIVGVMLYSPNSKHLSFVGVDPMYRKQGIASMMMDELLMRLDDIQVITYRSRDKRGQAARKLYKKYGFVESELVEVYGYPQQKMILKR